MEINKTILGIAAGVAGTLFLSYCIYFDKKRRSDPEYKKKVRDRRRKQKSKAAAAGSGMPNLNDHEAVERYFLQEIQLGESLIATGDLERGVEHLANSIVVCGQPAKLLQILQTSLPPQVFAMLIQKMQEYGSRSQAEKPKIGAVSASETRGAFGANPFAAMGEPVSLDDLE